MPESKSQTTRHLGRLKLIGAGLLLAAVGIVRMMSGIQVTTHWTGQPVFSWCLVAAGGICIVLALIPDSWVAKAANASYSKTRNR